MAAPLNLSTRRPWIWLPSALFFGFSLLLFIAAPGAGSRLFYAVLALAMGYWLVGTWRVGVEMTRDDLVIRGQLRRHRFPWTQLRGAALEPMRTASPLQRLFPYVALSIELDDGRIRQFEEVSASASNRASVELVVDEINARVAR